MSRCHECGMALRKPDEYHPFAACLMFKACGDSDTVRSNLAAVRSEGRRNAEQKNRAALFAITADLLRSDELPSPTVDDHRQNTYSASKIARMAGGWHEANRQRALAIRSIIDSSQQVEQER